MLKDQLKIESATKVVRNNKTLCYDIIENGVLKCVPPAKGNRHYEAMMRMQRAGRLQITERNVDGV